MSRPRKVRAREERLADPDPAGSRAQRRAWVRAQRGRGMQVDRPGQSYVPPPETER